MHYHNESSDASTNSTMNKGDRKGLDEKPSETPVSQGVLGSGNLENSNITTEPEKELLKESVHSISSVPNGGLKAWLQVLAAHILFFNSW